MEGPCFPDFMALIFLLLVFFFVVAAIAMFVFPPSKWVKMMQGNKSDKK
jgi:hypothetical protein